MKYLLIVFLLLSCTHSSQPTPNCASTYQFNFWNMLPVTPYEKARYNLDQIFRGYNLEYSFEGAQDFDYVKLNCKFSINQQQQLINPLRGLKSYHLDHVGNNWGESFITLTELGGLTEIHYGLLSDNKSAPTINYDVTISKSNNLTCFDAIMFAQKDLIIVDCVVKTGDPVFPYQNRFIYVKLSTGTIKDYSIDTQMYVGFKTLTKRKLLLYTDPETGIHYLLRSYFADGVDLQNLKNTYIDVFIITDPARPWTLKVIDRSLIYQKQLVIMDVQIYLGDIYLLDYKRGLLRMDITVDQQILITGTYQAQGFTRFGVYSNNLDDQFYIVLANRHSVYEIEWSNVVRPVLITKYSLLPDSNIQQVLINENYLVVQSFTDVNTTSQGVLQYNYTWIFNRGDRTYGKAYKVLNHNTFKTFIDLNKDKSYLMVFDEQTITNYAIARPIFQIEAPDNADLLNIRNNFTVKATSLDPLTNTSVVCQFILNFTILDENNKTLWDSGTRPFGDYAVNYPGRLEIPIYEYALGPNVTYQITPVQSKDVPESYVLQQNLTNLHWENNPGMISSRFLKTQQFTRLSNDTLVIYIQDLRNITYVASCTTDLEDINIYCNNTFKQDIGGAIIDWATTEFYSIQTLRFHHIIAYTTETRPSVIVIHDHSLGQKVTQLSYPRGFEGYVSSIQITANYLFVVQQYIKTILVYDLNYCDSDSCDPIYKIDHMMMYKLGIKYFNPIGVETSMFHPEVIFIQTNNCIIVLDVDREGYPVLLSIIESDATKSQASQFKFAINYNFLIVVNAPNVIEEYNLEELYQKNVYRMKTYPLYGYSIPETFDLDISDQGDTIYITVQSPTGSRNVFVYRGGYPKVAVLYDTIDINTNLDVLIDVTGVFEDFVTVVSGPVIRIYKQYELPLAIIENALDDSQFWIEYSNADRDTKLTLINVKVQNWPTSITVNDYYKDVMNTKNLLYSGPNRVSQFDDEGWYQGNVLRLEADCDDCHTKVTLKNHIHQERDILATNGMQQYQWGFDGGSIQHTQNLFHMKHNGSIDQIVNLPQSSWGQMCFKVAVPLIGNYHISACQSSRGVNLYVTSFISSKGFSWGPWSSRAQHCARIEVVGQLVMLVDVDPTPGLMLREGGVFIYAITISPDEDEYFTELQYINTDDFGGVTGWDDTKPAYIANAQLTFNFQTGGYRLILTEMNQGLFVVEFLWSQGDDQITIKKIDFIDLQKLLAANNYRVPYDSRFEAIALIRTQYNRTTELEDQSLLVTSNRFHTFQIDFVTDKSGSIIKLQLIRVYLRYSFYEIQNYIRFFDQYFVVSQIIPQEFAWADWYSRQIITVYHTRGNFNGTVQKRGFLGAYVLQERIPYNYDFNWTFFHNPDGTTQSRLGLVLIDRVTRVIKELSLYKNISVYTTEQLQSQIIYIDVINDFSLQKLRIYMHGKTKFAQWKVVIITIFSIIFLGILIGIGLFFFKNRLGGGGGEDFSQNKQSLLTESNRASIQREEGGNQ